MIDTAALDRAVREVTTPAIRAQADNCVYGLSKPYICVIAPRIIARYCEILDNASPPAQQ
jgi:hypothetical protein